MFSLILVYVIIIGYLGVTMYIANQEQASGGTPSTTRILLLIGTGIIALLGIYVLLLALNSAALREMAEQGEEVPLTEISTPVVIACVTISALAAFASYSVIQSHETRQGLARVIGLRGTYNPDSIVHTTAVVLCLLLVTANTIIFLVEGGTSGMAESIETQGISLGSAVFEKLIQVLAAFLGIGYAIRRNWPQALERLGLRVPSQEDITRGVVIGVGLFMLVIVNGIVSEVLIQSGVISSEQAEKQNEAAESLANAFATPVAAVTLSLSASIGEEIFFRGALQPVFGNVLTSILFALLHTQNLLSLGVILLFVVSLAFGWVRMRYNTTTAIIAHFTYNFIQLALLILATSSGAV